MPLDVRLRYLDGTTEAQAALDLDEASGLAGQRLQKLDADGWWRSFRHSGTVDAEGFAVFEEDPTVPKTKNTSPRTLEGTVFDEGGAPLASANVALVDRRDGKILGQGSTNEVGHFQLNTVTTKDRVSHDYVITRNGTSYELFDASIVTETDDAKVVELRVRL
jgi:hypothetical protein